MNWWILNAAVFVIMSIAMGVAARRAYIRGYMNGWDCAVQCMREMCEQQ